MCKIANKISNESTLHAVVDNAVSNPNPNPSLVVFSLFSKHDYIDSMSLCVKVKS